MKNFTASEVLKLVAGFDASADFTRRIQSLLHGLVSIGFHSARFYLKVENGADRSEVIQIINYAYRVEPPHTLLDTKILLNETTIYRNNDLRKGYSIGEPDDHRGLSWPVDLFLDDSYWIDLLISNPHTEEIYGLLAVSWSGNRHLVNEDCIAALRLVAARVTSWITQRSANIVQQRENLERKGFEVDPQTGGLGDDAIDSLLNFLQNSFGSDCVACFEFDFVDGIVRKIGEILSRSDGYSGITLVERYGIGQYLTGKAFVRPDLCFIPDFAHFRESDSSDLHLESINYHQERIGGIRSCLYGHVGFWKTSIFRAAVPIHEIGSWHLLKKDRDDLRYACDQLSYRLEREIREFQQSRIRTAATEAFRRLKTTEDRKDELVLYLTASKFGPFLLAVQDQGDAVPDLEFATGLFERYRDLSTWERSDLAALISSNVHFGRVHRIKASELPNAEKGNIRSVLKDHLYDELLFISTDSIHASITLLLPRNGRSGLVGDEQVGLSKNEEGFLISLLSIYAAATEAKKSLITAEKADHMLADLGHEVGTPVSILTQTAILACARAIDAVNAMALRSAGKVIGIVGSRINDPNDLIKELKALQLEVNELGGLVQIVTEIPRTLAQLGNSQIEVDFRAHRWSELIDDIWSDALDWAKVLNEKELGIGRVSKGNFILKKSENFGEKMFIGDKSLLRIAIGNVVKNALKYSLPRHRGMPMEIGIFLEPQPSGGPTFLNIRNWGVGIPQDSYRKIFGKYERIERRDRVRTIRGRGIGLFLARSFVRAHGGDIVCRGSSPTLDDPARTLDLEGFETTFRLWLPTSNELGKRMEKI